MKVKYLKNTSAVPLFFIISILLGSSLSAQTFINKERRSREKKKISGPENLKNGKSPFPNPDISCGAQEKFLIYSPVEHSKVNAIYGLGKFIKQKASSISSDKVYFYDGFSLVNNVQTPEHSQTPIVAPSDTYLVGIQYQPTSQEDGLPEYILHFAPCSDVTFQVGGVSQISDILKSKNLDVKEKVPGSVCSSNWCYLETKTFLKKGSLLGYVYQDGRPFFSMSVFDKRFPQEVANSSRFETKNSDLPVVFSAVKDKIYPSPVFANCPLDYFSPLPITSKLRGKLGAEDGSYKSNILPICGRAIQDKISTAQGYWFEESGAHYRDPQTMAYFSVGPLVTSRLVFTFSPKLANELGISEEQVFVYSNGGTPFNQVTNNSGAACYDKLKKLNGDNSLIPGSLVIDLSNGDLLIEYRENIGCIGVIIPTAAAIKLKR